MNKNNNRLEGPVLVLALNVKSSENRVLVQLRYKYVDAHIKTEGLHEKFELIRLSLTKTKLIPLTSQKCRRNPTMIFHMSFIESFLTVEVKQVQCNLGYTSKPGLRNMDVELRGTYK